MQFRFDQQTGQIASVAFEGLCATYTATMPLELLDCGMGDVQSFTFDESAMTFSPVSDPDACLAVGSTSRSAGPFMSRDLVILRCEESAEALKAWVIKH